MAATSLKGRGLDCVHYLSPDNRGWVMCLSLLLLTPPETGLGLGGPDGAGALSLEGGALFSFYNTEVRMQGNNRVKLVAFRRPLHSMNVQQM
eukprot:scaffold22506_cov136-Isochrysis_galbana.AAC.1